MQVEVLEKIIEEVSKGRKAALVFITESKGSVPGAKDSMMAVFENGQSFGTIGGGPVEYEVIKQATKAIEKGKDESFEHVLNQKSDLQMACGGTNKGYIKVFKPKPQLLIYGAGHVGQKLARVAIKTGFDVSIVDERKDYEKKEDFSGIKNFYAIEASEAKASINFDVNNTYIVICTPNEDAKALESLIEEDYKYLGMIGSRKKVMTVFDKMRKKGISQDLLEKVHSPVGLDIDNGSVEEIAISIMAEILSVKNGKLGDL